MIGDHDAAKDIVAEALQSVIRSFRSEGQFCRVLRTAVARRAIDRLRSDIRRRELTKSHALVPPDPEDPLVVEEATRMVEDLKHACSAKYGRGRGDLYVAYLLAERHGRKGEIASEFDLTLTAASHRVRRLRKKGIDHFIVRWLRHRGYEVADFAYLTARNSGGPR